MCNHQRFTFTDYPIKKFGAIYTFYALFRMRYANWLAA
jgi:hypothetical protein